MIPVIAANVAGFLAGKGAKIVLMGAAALSCFGAGAYAGHRWQAGNVANERLSVVRAQAEARSATEKRERAEADYAQIRQQVADAMQKAQERAIELESEHAAAAKRATDGYERRVATVLSAHRRLLDSIAAGGGCDRAGAVPGTPSARCAIDSSAERELIDRLRAADESEARLIELQNVVENFRRQQRQE